MKLPIRTVLAVPALYTCLGCVAAIGNRVPEGGKGPPDKADAAEDASDKLRKKERELAYAKMELDIARLSATADEREAENAVTEATQKLETVRKDRDNFKSLEMPTKLADKQLDLDRSAWSMEESRQELAELEGMYKKEDFASLTKELVLNRGKKRLEFSQRGLELAKKGQEELTGHELPKKEKDLEQSVEKAEKALAEANAKKERSAYENKLKILKAEHHADEAERELEKLKNKDKEKGKEAKA